MSQHELAGHRWLVLVSFGLSLLTSVGLLIAFTQLGSVSEVSQSHTLGTDGSEINRDRRPGSALTLGNAVLFTLPVIVSAAPLVARRRWTAIISRTAAAAVLGVWVLFLAFGGGMFYIPAASAMGLSALFAWMDGHGPIATKTGSCDASVGP